MLKRLTRYRGSRLNAGLKDRCGRLVHLSVNGRPHPIKVSEVSVTHPSTAKQLKQHASAGGLERLPTPRPLEIVFDFRIQ